MSAVDPLPAIHAAFERCVAAICGTAFTHGDRAGWLSWELDGDGEAVRMVGGRPGLYDGDAGVAWALATLASAAGRKDLAQLAALGVKHLSAPAAPGLLAGQAGVLLAQHRAGLAEAGLYGVGPSGVGAVSMDSAHGADLTGGLAGLVLAQVRLGSCDGTTTIMVNRLRELATVTPMGVCWPESPGPEGRALCGLAHGNSGVVLALAEAAAAHPPCAEAALRLAVEALRWESAWFDPMAGGWPDLRTDPPAHPAVWCHGAAGIALVRLRLLQLPDSLGLPRDLLRAEAEAAVAACGAELLKVVSGAEIPGGLSLCHGLGGALEALIVASETWGVAEHLDAARGFSAAALEALGEDPLAWPAGVRAEGSTGLFVGVAGAALVLARLIAPERLGSPALLL